MLKVSPAQLLIVAPVFPGDLKILLEYIMKYVDHGSGGLRVRKPLLDPAFVILPGMDGLLGIFRGAEWIQAAAGSSVDRKGRQREIGEYPFPILLHFTDQGEGGVDHLLQRHSYCSGFHTGDIGFVAVIEACCSHIVRNQVALILQIAAG